jgi:hypothetical protein
MFGMTNDTPLLAAGTFNLAMRQMGTVTGLAAIQVHLDFIENATPIVYNR